MGKIFCLIGKSCSGKDSILSSLQDKLKFKTFVSYTTRPKRDGEEEGKEYHFIDDQEMLGLKKTNKIIESRSYNTGQGRWTYATVKENDFDLKENNYLAIVDIDGSKSFIQYFGENNVIGIYIDVNDADRIRRAIIREQNQSSPDYVELCRRFIADTEAFDLSLLKDTKHVVVKNKQNDFNTCINTIILIINTTNAILD